MTTVFQRLTVRFTASLRFVFECRQQRLYSGLSKGYSCFTLFFHITKCSEVSSSPGKVWQLHITIVLKSFDFSVFPALASCKRDWKMCFLLVGNIVKNISVLFIRNKSERRINSPFTHTRMPPGWYITTTKNHHHMIYITPAGIISYRDCSIQETKSLSEKV